MGELPSQNTGTAATYGEKHKTSEYLGLCTTGPYIPAQDQAHIRHH